jgi:Response regulator containing a CheY-like receiver domain and an HTH DNA-binding domain
MKEDQRKSFMDNHPYLADFELPLAVDRLVPLQKHAKQQTTSVATCHLASEKYHFLSVDEQCRNILPNETLSIEELEALVHPNDSELFSKSQIMGLKYAQCSSLKQLHDLALVFESRLLGNDKQWHLMLLKYTVMGYGAHEDRGEVILYLKYISGDFELRHSEGCAIIDTSTKSIVHNNDFCQITQREKEVLRLVNEGMSSKRIAGKLDIIERTVEKHRENILRKTRLGNLSCAYIYLHAADLI